MEINLPPDADGLIRSKAAAAGFGDDFGAYMLHLVNQDEPFGENLGSESAMTISTYDRAVQLGIVGMSGEGPADLATNPKFMEGFGANGSRNGTH